MRRFWKCFKITSQTRVLDVGGTLLNWSLMPASPVLTICNMSLTEDGRSVSVVGDGRYLPFKDGAFDIVYSNSVIEHLKNFENQKLFSSECRRVGNNYYVQTPDKKFPIEPHFITPFIHWLPFKIKKIFIRNFTVWGLITRPTKTYRNMILKEINLLGKTEMKVLFPDAKIIHERFFSFSKSLIAIKNNKNNIPAF